MISTSILQRAGRQQARNVLAELGNITSRFSNPMAVFLISFGTYLVVISASDYQHNIGGDSGELITASYTLGVPHPPGYPTYTILGKAFSLIPLGSIVLRYHLFSAISMAITIGLISEIISRKRPGTSERIQSGLSHSILPIALGLIIGLSPLAISQATRIEVYALNLVFVVACIWSITTFKGPLVQGFLFGLAITTHLTSLFLFPVIVSFNRREHAIRILIGLVLGLSPFLLIPLLSSLDSPIIWGNSRTIEGWIWLITGRLYQENLSNSQPEMISAKLLQWSPLLISMMLLIGSVFVVHYRGKKLRLLKTTQLLSVAGGFLLYFFFSVIYQPIDSVNYLLPGLVLISLILSLAADHITKYTLLFLFVLGVALFLIKPSPNPQMNQHLPKLLRTAPTNSIVITPGDTTVGASWYLIYVENVRPDIILVDYNLFQFDWYREQIAASNQNVKALGTDDLNRFIEENSLDQPVCLFHTGPDIQMVCKGMF